MGSDMPVPTLIDTKQLSEATNTCESYWEKLRLRNEGPAFYKLGRAVRYRWDVVEAWLRAQNGRAA